MININSLSIKHPGGKSHEQDNTTYSIGIISTLTGIEKHKLRNWCDRYLTFTLKIEIGNTQHRRFTEEGIALIKKIKEYRRKGFMLNVAVENARQDIMAGKI